MTQAERKAIRAEHEAIWPGLAARFKMSIREQHQAIELWRRERQLCEDIQKFGGHRVPSLIPTL